ncbi:MAG: decaprenyl-phosphate phosphoribosyltransferase [Anaerolineales bacterium]|nr:decaprenyl-phosphate phosphoribosyltransferase [Anaerolineales bacterium]
MIWKIALLPLSSVPAIMRPMVNQLLNAMRPKQWVKNGILFTALVFDQQLLHLSSLLRTLGGFFIFCMGASAVYLINDLVDLEQDRQHPLKRKRPLASGKLSKNAAATAAIIFSIVALGLGFWLEMKFGLIILAYMVLNLVYSFYLKNIPIIDVLVIAAGFVLRVGAGVVLVTVQRFSPWMYVCVTLISLFMGLGKRRAEMVLLADNANSHRRVLDGYTLSFIDHLLSIVSSTTILAYSLYTFSAENLPPNHLMMLTIPFVIYGIFRYLYLVHVQAEGGAPEELLLSDKPLMATVALWGITSVAILYFSV